MKQSLVCFIGNSHLAAVKLGWDASRQHFPGVSVEMFAAHGDKIRETFFRDGLIVPRSAQLVMQFKWTNESPVICLEKYAAFYIVAAGFSSVPLFNLYRQYGFWELNSRRSRLISQDCFRCAARDWLRRDCPAVHILKLIRLGSRAPVYFCSQPLPSDACLEDSRSDIPHKEAVANGDAAALLALYADLCRDVAEELGVEVVPQPASTVSGSTLTKREFSDSSVGLSRFFSVRHSPDDYWHMNSQYGVEVLKALFEHSPAANPASPPS